MKALRKDFYIQVKKTLNRFISILLIVALGAAFYVGIRSTEPDMRESADKLFDDTSLMDIKIMSTMGLTDDDVNTISSLESVELAVGTYSEDVIASKDDEQCAVKVMAYTDNINVVELKEGRLPENESECIVDLQFAEAGYEIGSKINLDSDNFTQNDFTIVGIFTSSYYLSLDKGSTSIDKGKLSGIVVVSPEVFDLDYYTEIYVLAAGAKDLVSYTEAYNDCVETTVNDIEDNAMDKCIDNRYNSIVDEANAKIDAAKADVEAIERPEWYVLDRDYITSYTEYGQDAEKVGNIGRVVPIIFFIVAAMVSLNTMTRMVTEDRTKIGTIKALGYGNVSIAMKYILYGFFATIIGAVFGGVAGSRILPYVIMSAYKIMFINMDIMITNINIVHFSVAVIASIVSVIGATLLACIKTLKTCPAELMRPESPKEGKRVLLERIPFVWKRLNFQHKSTVRNLFRYKKRLFMTLFGISGCMALMILGFGLKDSISSLSYVQFCEINKYDAMVTYDSDASDEDKQLVQELFDSTEGIEKYTQVSQTSADINMNDTDVSGYIVVPQNVDELSDYVRFRNRKTKEKYTLNEDEVLISEKLAKLLGAGVGDTIYIKDDETKHEVKVGGIFENYVYHYVYMLPELYEKIYGEAPDYNVAMIIGTDTISEHSEEISEEFLKNDTISSITFIADTRDKFEDMLGSLDTVILVLVVSAGALAFVVLYNLNNINISERNREIATLKVLGFYDSEVSAYIFRENVVITFIGILIGIVLGMILHRFIIATTEIDIMMFGRKIKILSFVYSSLLTLLFALIINISMHFKLKKVDMATSLKSVE